MTALAQSHTLGFLVEGLSIWHFLIFGGYLLVCARAVRDIWRQDKTQEVKLLWTIVIFVAPMFLGVIAYFIFGRQANSPQSPQPPQPPTY